MRVTPRQVWYKGYSKILTSITCQSYSTITRKQDNCKGSVMLRANQSRASPLGILFVLGFRLAFAP